jgi:hypothetical protein
VRYWLDQEPLVLYACHCLECRKQSASGFGLSVPIWRENLRIEGPMSSYDRPTESGTTTRCWFCKACGVRLFHQSSRAGATATLKGGTLDILEDLTPVAHIWVSRKLPWVLLDPDTPAWETQPEDLAAWREGLMGPVAT